ncbi:MAG: hypothetical protein ACYTJ0_08470 [Planctomycetota bacterium]
MPDSRPIDPRQHVWWHRLRRLGPVGFVALIGCLASPLLTVALFGGVIYAFRYPWATFVRVGSVMWLLTAPVYAGACAWTWVYMEQRYRATLGVRCPGCGYTLRGVAGPRCPECGTSIAVGSPLQADRPD